MKLGAAFCGAALLMLAACSSFHHETPVDKEQAQAQQALPPTDPALAAPPVAAPAQPMSAATATPPVVQPATTPGALPVVTPAPAAPVANTAKPEPKWKMRIDERPLICNNNGADSCDDAIHR
ncbi:MAG: hypothetical protein PW788_00960 [Micavibrio sp.]|nr:hypothetical protein [Micavibrio sp.]